MKIIFCTIFCLISLTVFSQTHPDLEKGYTFFTIIQIPPKFPGGEAAWKNYLKENLDMKLAKKCLNIPKEEEGISQTMTVLFKIDKEGNTCDISVEDADLFCPKLVKEAIRIIRESPRWTPGQSNGRIVTYPASERIVWVLKKSSKAEQINYDEEVKFIDEEPTFRGGKKDWLSLVKGTIDDKLKAEYLIGDSISVSVVTCYLVDKDSEIKTKSIWIKKLDSIPEQPVTASFLVNKDGEVSEVIIENAEELNPRLTESIIKAIKHFRWIPARLNDRDVIFRHREKINLLVYKPELAD